MSIRKHPSTSIRLLELLAPAKNLECGMAAIDHGADAVYIGPQRFGARAAAGNATADISKLCQYAHQYDAKVYATVNTILYDAELDATDHLLHELEDAGVDAILVQDMAILQSSKFRVQSLELHASTQTDNRSVEKVRWLRSLGFRRVVLARELSLREIAEIHDAVPDVELEVFVHGALCVSYSGICYASQHCFGRSANRGECAQFCRMPFDLVDASGSELIHQRHLLSLKDMNQFDHLEELCRAGATSFKIEGRLKDVTYVKNVVAAYSQQLDAVIARHPQQYRRSSRGHCTYTFEPNLNKTFNRGFTTYFLHGRQPDIFSPDTPKALGEYVGRVKEVQRTSFTIAGTASFANGDGLCFFDRDHQLQGFRVNRVEGNRLFPQHMPPELHKGMGLYRNQDQQFSQQLSRPSAQRRIPLVIRLEPTADGFSLTAEGTTVSVPCPHQEAQKPQRENIVRQLSRLGDTIYECHEVIMPDDFHYFIPNSILADLRSLLVKNLQEASSATSLTKASRDDKADTAAKPSHDHQPDYPYDFLYNIANHESAAFYGKPVSAYELHGGNGPIMQCRHCLRYSLGYCVKNGGRKAEWTEPLSLRLADGRVFPLEFDCNHCQMNVYATH